MRGPLRVIIAGLAGGFVGNGILGALFSAPILRNILYDPSIQSALFIEVTSQRNIPVSVVGLVVLSVIHAWLFTVFLPAVPGKDWLRKGMFWGLTIFLMYWLFQEWFMFHTLLQEPLILNLLELIVLLFGSLVEGIIIAYILVPRSQPRHS